MTNSKSIAKVWLTNKVSATLIIPKEIALKHGLDEARHVIVEDTDEGILIRRLEI